ncbi:MAG: hypothetical protein JWQ79_2850 [Mucilaginibacter sp.]|nr:hypothetical protein [Mucilaginibacter sp.]
MKIFIYFVITCFISTGALLGALNAKNPFPSYAIGFGIWAVFLWAYNRHAKKRSEKNQMERLFRDYMRMQQWRPNR